MATYETRGVLAGAYSPHSMRQARTGKARLLSHAVELDDAGTIVGVLCKRVALESILDDAYAAETPPTCPVCLRRDPRQRPPPGGAAS